MKYLKKVWFYYMLVLIIQLVLILLKINGRKLLKFSGKEGYLLSLIVLIRVSR